MAAKGESDRIERLSAVLLSAAEGQFIDRLIALYRADEICPRCAAVALCAAQDATRTG